MTFLPQIGHEEHKFYDLLRTDDYGFSQQTASIAMVNKEHKFIALFTSKYNTEAFCILPDIER